MKEGWKYVKLGEVCDVNAGSTPLKSKKEYWDNGTIPWFTIDDIREQGRIIHKTNKHLTKEGASKTRIFPVDTVLLCCTASVGEYALTKIETASNQQFNGLVIKDKEQICPCFLLYYCATLKEHLLQLSGKTTIDFVSGMKVKNLTVPIPPLSEQYQIVSFLDSEFAKIDAMKANVELALQNAKDLFQASLKEMMTPKDGWKEKMLRDISVFRNGVAHEKNIDKNGHYIVVNSKFISSNGIIKKFTSEQKSPLYKEDIVMVMSDVPNGKTLAKCFVVDKNDLYSLNQRICAFSKHKIDTRYLYHQINRNHYFLSFDNGENQTNLRKEDILDCPIFFPNSIEEQNHLAVKLDKLVFLNDVLQSNYTRIISECDALKQALLRQVFE